jgi:hypothetical protein
MVSSNKTCQTCLQTFSTNANLKLHTNRRIPCVAPEIIAPELKVEHAPYKHKCERCELRFQTNKKLMSHLHRKFPCKIKNPTEEEIELRVLFEQLKADHLKQQEEHLKQQEEHLQQQEEIKQLKQQVNTANGTTNNNNTKNTTNNIQNNNNVTINVYGKEDTSHITDAMVLSCFDDFDKSIEKYFDMKHFSKRMKCNHNIYISNMRDGYMMVFNTKKWNIVNKEVTLKKMYYEIKEILSNEWDRMRNKNAVASHIESIYPRFIEYEIDDERELLFQTASCDKMACMAYNNRDFPMNKKKQWDKEQKEKEKAR